MFTAIRIICVIFLVTVSAGYGQAVIKYDAKTESITFQAPDSMSVKESFKLVKKLVPEGLCAHTRYVIKGDKTYMRKYYVHNIFSRKTYVIEK